MEATGHTPTADGIRIDGERAAYRAHVSGRWIVYLDTVIWIHLQRNDEPVTRQCRSLCEAAVKGKRAIFPLSYAACSELVQQAPSPSRDARMQLMQSLSEGISFRDFDTVKAIEAEAALPLWLGEEPSPPDVSRLFAGVQECISDIAVSYAALDRPPPEEFVAWLRAGPVFKALTEYVRICDRLKKHEEATIFFDARRDLLSPSIVNAANACRSSNGKVNRKKAFLQEAFASARSAYPALKAAFAKRQPEDERKAMERAHKDARGVERLRELLSGMPSVATEAELNTERVMHPERKHKGREDLWDVEHAIVPAPYSDVWVTRDSWSAGLVRSCDTPRKRGCTVIDSIDDFAAWLKLYVQRSPTPRIS